MRKSFIYRFGYYVIIGLIISIGLCSIVQWYRTSIFDSKPVTISSEMDNDLIKVTYGGITENTDIWETVLPQSEDPEDVLPYKGATISTTIENLQKNSIKDWTMRLNVDTECYLNGFWCGNFEIHQLRDDQEIVELVNISQFDKNNTQLEVALYSNEPMIHLMPGDYLIYYPSVSEKEDVIEREKTVGIGFILYFQQDPVLSMDYICYYNVRNFTDGELFHAICGMLIVLCIYSIIYSVSYLTYRKVKKDVDSVTHSVINGLSMEYKSLWLININKKTIQLIRNEDENDIQNAVSIAKGFKDYDTAINYYINHYVDKKDRERVRKEVVFDNLIEHLSQEKFFTVNYVHHPYDAESHHFQMAFTQAANDREDTNIVLAYRNIDQLVKEEQEKQHQLEEALQQAKDANQSKSIFLANMSHEIRTPINAILGMDTMILREATDESVKAYARDIKSASNTLLSLINDILDFSKIESGKMEIVESQYHLDSIINDVINMMKPRALEKGLDFVLDLNPNTPTKLCGDEVRVKQIIVNLLSNAIKYTNAGKVIWTVDFDKTEPDVCALKIAVKDTGIGIKPEDMENITSPYKRLDATINRSVEGTGLGLNITKNLLEKMGSQLQIESTYEEGSEFSFVVNQKMWGQDPIGDHLNDSYDEAEMPEKFHSPDAKILVVDDVEMNLMVVKGLLKRIQVEPEMSLSGKEALELACANKYDLILLDAMMPHMSGEDTLKLIRKESKLNQDTPIVVLTANAVMGAKEDYISKGFTDYLSKPIDGILLEDLIEQYLPKDKVIYAGTDGFEETLETAKHNVDNHSNDDLNNPTNNHTKTNQYLEKIMALSAMDTKKGMEASGGEDTYISVCRNFCDTAQSRMEMIREYYTAKDFENYTIQTHALKSSARLVGAMELSELAFTLEQAGKAADEATINEHTMHLLELYKDIQDGLYQVFDQVDQTLETQKPKKELSDKKLRRKLNDLQELVAAYDFESAKQLFDTFEQFTLPSHFEAFYSRLKTLIAEVEYDTIAKEIEIYLESESK